MAEKFDAFSKHIAKKQTRRGALKLLGATLVGGVASAFVSKERADATPSFNGCYFNGTVTSELVGCFNGNIPDYRREPVFFLGGRRRPRFNGYLPF